MGNHLHLGIIFKGTNLNYGESMGNYTSLKKCSIGEQTYSYITRQAIRYDIVRIMEEECGYDKAEVDNVQKVVQFASGAKITDYPEIDFFGYMKTEKKKSNKNENENQDGKEGKTKIRKAIARISDAVSLEPFYNEIDFSTNMGLAARKNLENQIYQTETHRSYYSYSVTVDLDKVGVDENDSVNLDTTEKIKRLKALLYSVKTLNRDIKGRRENLNPIFVIGGIYESGNPFFYNQFKLSFSKDGVFINENIVNAILETQLFNEKPIKEDTQAGAVNSHFKNTDKLNTEVKSVEKFFTNLNNKIKQYFEDQN